ncbi:MAG: pyridoxal 5'-phosphate synthase glutaminase subunit PdxT [Microthrixaceae bacterium]
MKVGVLALQGAFAAHVRALRSLDVAAFEVRTPEQLAEAARLVIPGGESTTMSMMIERSGMADPLREWLALGRPVLGTCAGTILLASRVAGGRTDQLAMATLDVSVTRNAFGSQRESFEADLEVKGLEVKGLEAEGLEVEGLEREVAQVNRFHAVFIRAPRIDSVGSGVEVLARIDGTPALVRSEQVLGATFHPELSGDNRIHAMFCGMHD